MSRAGRWSVASAATATLIALPIAVARLPPADSTLSAGALLARVRASGRIAYSGYAESLGTLALPTGAAFSELTDLFGGRNRLRVWWRDETDWRVDTIAAAGERDAYRDPVGTWFWDFERDRATRVVEPAYRPPLAADLGPAELGRRLLSEARPAELQRLPSRRISGRAAAGLRLHPSAPEATVGRVDAWIEPATGLPLRVEVWGKHSRQPALQSSFLDLKIGRPAAGLTRFSAAQGAQIVQDNEFNLDDLATRLSFRAPPEELVGLPRRRDTTALGTYGRGPVLLAAVPLPAHLGFHFDERVAQAPGAQVSSDGSSSLSIGPLSVLVANIGDRAWLFTGTVTVASLQRAADQLRRAPAA